jgi:uncharacterized protein (TIGR03437 family)
MESTHDNRLTMGLTTPSGAAVVLMFALLGATGMAQPPKSLVVVNAGSGGTVVAPNSIASAFGKQIGASTQSALSLPLPTMLSGVSVQFTDISKASVLDPLFYVAPNQINFVVPDTVAPGTATVKILNGDSTPPSTTVEVAIVAPGLFTANGAGTGVPAAIAIRRSIATQTDTPVPVFHCDANSCTSMPIDTGADGQVFLELFGTGIRGRTSLANVTATLGGVSAPVLFAGAQGQFPGLDQVNVQLPSNSPLHGEHDIDSDSGWTRCEHGSCKPQVTACGRFRFRQSEDYFVGRPVRRPGAQECSQVLLVHDDELSRRLLGLRRFDWLNSSHSRSNLEPKQGNVKSVRGIAHGKSTSVEGLSTGQAG